MNHPIAACPKLKSRIFHQTAVPQMLLLLSVLLLTACTKDAAFYMQKGDASFREGKFEEALLNYRNAIQKEPNIAEAYFKVGQTELKLNNRRAMIAYWQQALKLAPQQAAWRVALCDQLFDLYLNDPSRPTAIAEELISNSTFLTAKSESAFEGHRLKGQLALLENRIPEAIEAYEAALRLKPGAEAIALGLAQARLRSGDAQIVAAGEKALLEWINREPTNAVPFEALFVHYAGTGREKLAEDILRLKLQKNPANINAYSQMADYLAKRQRVPEADGIINQMLTLASAQPRAHALAGDYFGRQRRFAESQTQYELAAARISEAKQELKNRFALILLTSGESDKASQYLDELLRENSGNLEATAMRATLALDTGKPQMALEGARKLIQSDPNNAEYCYLLGRALMANGINSEARTYFQKALKLNPRDKASSLELANLAILGGVNQDAIRITTEILDSDENHVPALLVRAQAYASLLDMEKARLDLRKALRLRPDSADAKMQLAYVDALSNRTQDAEKVFSSFYRPGLANLRPLEGLVLVAQLRKTPQVALALLEKENALQPAHPRIAWMYADALMRQNMPAPAVPVIEKALKENAQHPELLLSYSRALEGVRKFSLSESVARQLLAIPGVEPLAAKARLAEVLQIQGKNKEAIALYQELTKLDGRNPVFLNNLAFLLAEEKQNLDQARALVNTALKQAPGNPQVLDTLALIEIQSGRPTEALSQLTKLSKALPGDAGIHYHLGLALQQTGKAEQARAAFEVALKNGPTEHQAAQIKNAQLQSK